MIRLLFFLVVAMIAVITLVGSGGPFDPMTTWAPWADDAWNVVSGAWSQRRAG